MLSFKAIEAHSMQFFLAIGEFPLLHKPSGNSATGHTMCAVNYRYCVDRLENLRTRVSVLNPLSTKSDQHEISLYNITAWISQIGHEN